MKLKSAESKNLFYPRSKMLREIDLRFIALKEQQIIASVKSLNHPNPDSDNLQLII